MFWHFMFSSIGVVMSLYISWQTGLWYIAIANFACVLLLFGYSVSLKKKLLSGNVLISLLTAWVILVLCFSETGPLVKDSMEPLVREAHTKIFRIGILYAGFAFISSLIREAIKDMEDMNGDARYGCRTMPIVWGVNATKIYVSVWLIVLITTLAIVQAYVLQFKWWAPVAYSIAFVILPLIYIFIRLLKAQTAREFAHLSAVTKLIMLAGILSMFFFYFYL